MPRKPRRCVPGVVHHLISRFVDREWFITKELERTYYLKLLGQAIERSDWRCLAYAVMSNHIHIAAIAGHDKLDTWIRRVNGPFADYMNREQKRIGNLFVRGPKSIAFPNDRVGHLIAYLHNNPVRAKLVQDPAGSDWTSHRAYLGLARAPSWLAVERGLELAARGSAESFGAWAASAPAHPLFGLGEPDETYEEIIARYEEAHVSLFDRVENNGASAPPSMLLEHAASAAGIATSQLLSRRRGHREVLARAIVVRSCDVLGYTSTQIARALGVSTPAVLWLRNHHAERADVIALSAEVLVVMNRERAA